MRMYVIINEYFILLLSERILCAANSTNGFLFYFVCVRTCICCAVAGFWGWAGIEVVKN